MGNLFVGVGRSLVLPGGDVVESGEHLVVGVLALRVLHELILGGRVVRAAQGFCSSIGLTYATLLLLLVLQMRHPSLCPCGPRPNLTFGLLPALAGRRSFP